MKSGADLAAKRIAKLGGAQDLQPKKGSGQLTLGRMWGAGAAEGGGSQGTIIRGGGHRRKELLEREVSSF